MTTTLRRTPTRAVPVASRSTTPPIGYPLSSVGFLARLDGRPWASRPTSSATWLGGGQAKNLQALVSV